MFCSQFETNLAPIPWTVMGILVLNGFNRMESSPYKNGVFQDFFSFPYGKLPFLCSVRFQFFLIPTDFYVQAIKNYD